MVSVTQRIKQIQQPKGGYVSVKLFAVTSYDDGKQLGEENLHAAIVGTVVDYLTRYCLNKNAQEAFKISLSGAKIAKQEKLAQRLLKKVNGIDDDSIISACKLAGFDVLVRAGKRYYKPVENIHPNLSTIKNIQIMVQRSLAFFEIYGPVIKDGFTFGGGYTETVSAGDGDFLTKDTLWDFKVSKSEPTKDHTLQLLMYYIMGKKSIHREFDAIKKIGFFNPRLNKVYVLSVSEIQKDVIKEVSDSVIGYALSKQQEKMKGNNFDKAEQFATVAQVSEILNISKSKIYSWIHAGSIKAIKQGNKYMIDKQSVINYVEAMQRRRKIATIISIVIVAVMLALFVCIMVSLI